MVQSFFVSLFTSGVSLIQCVFFSHIIDTSGIYIHYLFSCNCQWLVCYFVSSVPLTIWQGLQSLLERITCMYSRRTGVERIIRVHYAIREYIRTTIPNYQELFLTPMLTMPRHLMVIFVLNILSHMCSMAYLFQSQVVKIISYR